MTAETLRLRCKLPRVIAAAALQMLLLVLAGWLERREREAIAYLIKENRLLRRQLGGTQNPARHQLLELVSNSSTPTLDEVFLCAVLPTYSVS